MNNTISVREVVEIFEHFCNEFILDDSEDNTESLGLSLNFVTGSVRMEGHISYSRPLLSPRPKGRHYLSVRLTLDSRGVFCESYSPEYKKGFLSSGWVCSADMLLILDLVKRIEKPLREEWAQLVRDSNDKFKQEARDSADRLRKIMR